MPNRPGPEILKPQSRSVSPAPGRPFSHAGGRWFSDENLDLLSHLLDDWFRIPGTSIRFGLDGIIGFIPGLGDVLSGLASCILIVAAWLRGVPYIGLARMVVNLAIDVLIGAIPFLGDIFDIAWKANRRNYALMVRHLAEPRRHTWKDFLFLGFVLAILAVIFALPVLVLIWLAEWFRSHH